MSAGFPIFRFPGLPGNGRAAEIPEFLQKCIFSQAAAGISRKYLLFLCRYFEAPPFIPKLGFKIHAFLQELGLPGIRFAQKDALLQEFSTWAGRSDLKWRESIRCCPKNGNPSKFFAEQASRHRRSCASCFIAILNRRHPSAPSRIPRPHPFLLPHPHPFAHSFSFPLSVSLSLPARRVRGRRMQYIFKNGAKRGIIALFQFS